MRRREQPGPDNSQVRIWLGVPYATPPLDALRFRPPRPALRAKGIQECSSFPPASPQSQPGSISNSGKVNTSEDCLSLNIYRPERGEGLLPVLVWIHGGTFKSGSSGNEGAVGFASRAGVLIVTVQYRLGALGFISLESDEGNLGLRDQAMAISWVRENIEQFGGDPGRITLGGQEAGANSAGHLLSSVPDLNLQGAILQSGGPGSPLLTLTREQANTRTASLAAALGCGGNNPAACLRDRTHQEIVNLQDQVCSNVASSCFLPMEDGRMVKKAANNSSSTPVLMGFNSNEGFLTLMQFLTKEFPTEKLHTEGFSRKMAMKMISKMFPSLAAESHKVIDFLYSEWSLRGEQKASRRFLSLEKMVGDALYTCSQEEIGGLTSGPVFRYEFGWQASRDGWPVWSGVKQGDEMQFLMGPGPLDNPAEYLIEEKELSSRLIQYWTNFIYTGSPGPDWPKFTSASPLVMKLTAPPAQPEQLEQKFGSRCRLWKELLPKMEQERDKYGECAVPGVIESPVQGRVARQELHVDQSQPEVRRLLGEEEKRVEEDVDKQNEVVEDSKVEDSKEVVGKEG